MSAGPRALPLARLGYWYATGVGFLWGLIWSTGPIERHDGLWVFRGMPKWTFGRGGSCVGSCYLTDQNAGPAVLRHECVHREQWRRYGLAMPLLYALAGRDPLRNRFEVEAGLRDGGYLRGPVPRTAAAHTDRPPHQAPPTLGA
ncbi:Fe-S oxidoreductase [Leucobacter luti]|uniref:Fe-S oxidoreductase n=1 Tax=Leucobacter luti TaxID=340320 RepID=UPI00215D8297|nr:Fe-S oxidoreductase [Leucobacter luti]